jgi:hypothetical protein
MDSERRSKVQAEMEKITSKVGTVIMISGSALIGPLEAAGGEECVKEPLCLADVGEQAGAERILIAHVASADGKGLELKVDYFDVDDKLYIKYDNTSGLNGTGGIVNAIEPSLNKIFDVRELVDGEQYADDENKGVVQTVLAYSTAVWAVGFLTGGGVMGLGAKSAENDVKNGAKNSLGVYESTQVDARESIRPAQKKATTANVFYGLSAGLAAVSVLFFLIRGGSDVDKSESQGQVKRGLKDIQVAPAVTADGFGVGAGFRF